MSNSLETWLIDWSLETWCHLISSSSGCRLNRVHLDVHAEHSDMPPGMSPRLDHMYVWYNHVHYQPPSCCMASFQRRPPWYPCGVNHPAVTTAPLQHRPPGCHHDITPASTTWLSPRHHSSVDHLAVTTTSLQRRPPGCHHGTTPASTTWLSPRHHSSVDHLVVTLAPLRRRPPGCHHGTTPASTTWLSPRHHSSVDHLAVTLATLQRRPLSSLHDVTLVLLPISALSLTTETTDDPGRAPICRPCLLCLWDGAQQHVAVFVGLLRLCVGAKSCEVLMTTRS